MLWHGLRIVARFECLPLTSVHFDAMEYVECCIFCFISFIRFCAASNSKGATDPLKVHDGNFLSHSLTVPFNHLSEKRTSLQNVPKILLVEIIQIVFIEMFSIIFIELY